MVKYYIIVLLSYKFGGKFYNYEHSRCNRRPAVHNNVHNIHIRAPRHPQARVPVVLARALAARRALRAVPRARPRAAHRRAEVLDILPRTSHYLHFG